MLHPLNRTVAPAVLAAALLVLTACGTTEPGGTAADPAPAVDELTAGPCPTRLPGTGEEAFGSSDPAGSAPELAEPDRAWVCSYRLGDGAQGTSWVREARPEEVRADRLPALTDALTELAPADDDRACTEELGPRHLLVLADDGDAGTDLTGLVLDGYGCRDVRLTDDPHATPPGEASAPGVVPGVLTAPDDLVATLTGDLRR